MNEEGKNQITRYSFILTVFVIWLHAGEALISSIPGQIAVPGFFILSGFLFFFSPAEGKTGTEGETSQSRLFPDWLKEKLRRRVHTVLLPYLLWNFIYFLIYLLAGKAELSELPSAVWHYSCNPVFWYLFQLLLILLLTPLLNQILQRKWTALVWLAAVFSAAVLYGRIHQAMGPGLINEDALFYFSFGGYLAVYHKERLLPADREAPPATGETAPRTRRPETAKKFLVLAAVCLLLDGAGCLLPADLVNMAVIGCRVSGAGAVWFLSELLSGIRIRPWMRITFFIYATHYMVIRAVWALETALGQNGIAAANIAVYLLMPAVCTAAAWGLACLMKKFTPKLLGLLTGGRG